jgi:biotin carboxyl carrier protein
MDFQFQLGAELKTITLDHDGENYRAQIDDRAYRMTLEAVRSDELIFAIDDRRHTAIIASDGSKYFVAIDGDVIELTKPDAQQTRRGKHHHGEDSLAASMPGQVTKVLVGEGDHIERGQTLIMLEAMKMEIKINAPHAGHVIKLHVKLGQVVDRGQALIELAE